MEENPKPAKHSPTTHLFIPDVVFKCRKVDFFTKSVFLFGYAETTAHGSCRFHPYLIQWVLDAANEVKTYDGRSVNRSLRKLIAQGFVERDPRQWRVAGHLLKKDPKGKAVPGKIVPLIVWLNPMFTEAETLVYSNIYAHIAYTGKTFHLTDREMAEQTGLGEDAVRTARRALIRKRCLQRDGMGRRMVKTGNRIIPYCLTHPMGMHWHPGARLTLIFKNLIPEYNRRLLWARYFLKNFPGASQSEFAAWEMERT
jgi:hypothetical protein